MLWWWRTTVITVIYGWMVYSCIVGVRPGSRVVVIPVFCIVIYPFQCRYRPFDHLTFIRSESQQKKWEFSGKEDWLLLVSICLATKVYSCISIILAWRKYSTLFTKITEVVVIPVNGTFCQSWWTLWAFLVNTIFACRRKEVNSVNNSLKTTVFPALILKLLWGNRAIGNNFYKAVS